MTTFNFWVVRTYCNATRREEHLHCQLATCATLATPNANFHKIIASSLEETIRSPYAKCEHPKLPPISDHWGLVATQSAGILRCDPARQPVGDVTGIAGRRSWSSEISGGRNRAGVVDASGLVVLAHVRGVGLLDALLEAGAAARPLCAVLDHLGDLALRAGVLDVGAAVAGPAAVVRLHETGVGNAIVSRGRAHTTLALLHHDRQDKALVDTGLRGDRLDGRLDISALLRRVVGLTELSAGDGNVDHVRSPHVIEAHPVALGRPSLRCLAVAVVLLVCVAQTAAAAARRRR